MPEVRERLHALDGLRGIAALVVVAHHAMLTIGPLAAPYFGKPTGSPLADLLVYSPLHLAWAGTEAVLVFFVLSGLVLVRSVANHDVQWERYYPSRMARLYLPVVAAAGLAWISFLLWHRESSGISEWLDAAPRTYSLSMFLSDSTLLDGTSGGVTPLWTLRWEVFFSLLLPAYVLLARRVRFRCLVPCAILVSALGVLGGNQALTMMPVFAIGAAIAVSPQALESPSRRLLLVNRRWRGLVGGAALLASALLVDANWWTPSIREESWSLALAHIGVLAGVVGIVALAIAWRPWQALLESRVVQWLGAVSFSLYLVHEPIIKAAAYTFPGSARAVAVAVVVSFLVAQGFFMLVERPVHRLSRRIRRGPSQAAVAQGPPATRP